MDGQTGHHVQVQKHQFNDTVLPTYQFHMARPSLESGK